MLCEECADHFLIFKTAQRARGVHQAAAGADPDAEFVEQRPLRFGGLTDVARAGGPLQVGRTPPGTRPAARGIHKYVIVLPTGRSGKHPDRSATSGWLGRT